MGVVEISSGDNLAVSEPLHRVKCLLVLALLHEPSRGFGAEEDQDGKRDGGDECGSELESPGDRSDVLDDGVGTRGQIMPGNQDG